MAKLPDATTINPLIPQSDRRIVSYNTSAIPDAMARAGAQIGALGHDIGEQQDKLEYAYAKSDLIRNQIDTESQLEQDPNYVTYKQRYTDAMAKQRSQSSAMITSGSARAAFEAEANLDITRGLARVDSMARQKEGQFGRATLDETTTKNLDTISRTSDPVARAALINATNDSIQGAVDRNYITPEMAVKQKQAFVSNYIETLPPDQQIKLLKPTFTTPPPSDTPRDLGADTVKPFTPERIAQVKDAVAQPSQYDDLFKEAATQNNLDWRELKTRAVVESGLNIKALGPKTDYGQSGGVMQLTEKTAKGLGVTDRNDPRQSIFGAAKLLADHTKQSGGDPSMVDRLYYGGPDKGKWGPNTEQYAQNMAAVRGTSAGGSPNWVYQIPADKRVEIIRRNQGVMRSDLESRVKDSVALAEQGIANPSPIAKEEFYLAYDGMQADRQYQNYAETQKLGEHMHSVAMMTPQQQAELLTKEKPTQATTGFAELQRNYELLGKAVQTVNTQRAEDSIAFAQEHNIAANNDRLDFNDMNKLGAQLRDRAVLGEMMSSDYGTPLKLMRNDEVKGFTGAMTQMNSDTKLAYLKNIRDNVSDENAYGAVIQQLRPDSPVTAIAGDFLNLDRKITTDTHLFKDDDTLKAELVASRLVRGEDLLNPAKADKQQNGTGKVFPMPDDSVLRDTFDSTVGNAFRSLPQTQAQAFQAYKAYYAAAASDKGNYTGKIDTTIAAEAVKAVVGNIAEKTGSGISGSMMVVPPWGMTESTFLDLSKIEFDRIVKQGGLNPEVTRWEDVTLRNTGEQGMYHIIVGNGFLRDKNNRELLINLDDNHLQNIYATSSLVSQSNTPEDTGTGIDMMRASNKEMATFRANQLKEFLAPPKKPSK